MADIAEEVSEAIKRRTIPRLANCGIHLAQDNTGEWYYLNHADTWQTYQGPYGECEAGCVKGWREPPIADRRASEIGSDLVTRDEVLEQHLWSETKLTT